MAELLMSPVMTRHEGICVDRLEAGTNSPCHFIDEWDAVWEREVGDKGNFLQGEP